MTVSEASRANREATETESVAEGQRADYPWCCTGKRRPRKALAARPATVRWHPFQLNADMLREGVERRGLSPADGLTRVLNRRVSIRHKFCVSSWTPTVSGPPRACPCHSLSFLTAAAWERPNRNSTLLRTPVTVTGSSASAGPDPQPEGRRRRRPAGRPGGVHRRVRVGQVVAGVRHPLRRGPAAVPGVRRPVRPPAVPPARRAGGRRDRRAAPGRRPPAAAGRPDHPVVGRQRHHPVEPAADALLPGRRLPAGPAAPVRRVVLPEHAGGGVPGLPRARPGVRRDRGVDGAATTRSPSARGRSPPGRGRGRGRTSATSSPPSASTSTSRGGTCRRRTATGCCSPTSSRRCRSTRTTAWRRCGGRRSGRSRTTTWGRSPAPGGTCWRRSPRPRAPR